MNRTEFLAADDASDVLAGILERAFDVAHAANPQGVTKQNCAEAIGYSGADAGNAFREHLRGTKPLQGAKLIQLLANKASVGQHVVAGLAAWFTARALAGACPSRIAALDELLRAVLALASALAAARADNEVDDSEALLLRAAVGRARLALDAFEAALATRPARELRS